MKNLHYEGMRYYLRFVDWESIIESAYRNKSYGAPSAMACATVLGYLIQRFANEPMSVLRIKANKLAQDIGEICISTVKRSLAILHNAGFIYRDYTAVSVRLDRIIDAIKESPNFAGLSTHEKNRFTVLSGGLMTLYQVTQTTDSDEKEDNMALEEAIKRAADHIRRKALLKRAAKSMSKFYDDSGRVYPGNLLAFFDDIVARVYSDTFHPEQKTGKLKRMAKSFIKHAIEAGLTERDIRLQILTVINYWPRLSGQPILFTGVTSDGRPYQAKHIVPDRPSFAFFYCYSQALLDMIDAIEHGTSLTTYHVDQSEIGLGGGKFRRIDPLTGKAVMSDIPDQSDNPLDKPWMPTFMRPAWMKENEDADNEKDDDDNPLNKPWMPTFMQPAWMKDGKETESREDGGLKDDLEDALEA